MTSEIVSEDILLDRGIKALQAGNTQEAKATLQSAIDTGVAGAHTWLALALAHLVSRELEPAEVAIDKTLELDPQSIRAHVFKGDICFEREDRQGAATHYGAALYLSSSIAEPPPAMLSDLQRIAQRQKYLSELFTHHLMEQLGREGYRRETASERFNKALDMLLGKYHRPEEDRRYPQAPHVFYMPDIPYHTFYPEESLPWLKELEQHTDTITAELQTLLTHQGASFSPYVHADLGKTGGDHADLLDSDSWTSAFLWNDGTEVAEVMAQCPRTTELMRTLPICHIKGFLPTVLFSKLSPGAKIAPHTGMLNTRLICHLPLIVPADCGLRVGADTRMTERGKAWAFDDSINHEAWNNSREARIILLFDVWRPELDEQERHLIKTLLEAVQDARA